MDLGVLLESPQGSKSTVVKPIKENLNKQKNTYQWIIKFNSVSTSPRFVKRLNAIPVKSPVDVSMEIDAAAAAASLQSCPTLCHPIDHQASLSLGFSRQEHWSGLPFPSPMCESEK